MLKKIVLFVGIVAFILQPSTPALAQSIGDGLEDGVSVTVDATRSANDVLYSGEACSANSPSSTPATNNSTTGANTGQRAGPSSGCGSSDPRQNKIQIWNYLKGKGLTDAAAAGIMGNMSQESGFMPTADNGKTMGFRDSTGRGCRGVVQWCHERNSGLDTFAAQQGSSWDCLGTQLDYMWYEMTETTQGQVNGKGEKLEIPLADALNGGSFGARSKYDGISEPAAAAQIFHDYFERANTAKGEHLGRGDKAEEIYKEFNGSTPTTAPSSGSPTGSGQPQASQACTSSSASSSASNTSSGTGSGNGTIPPEDCAELTTQYNQLVASGKIDNSNNPSGINNDVKNCKITQINCGGGVHPRTMRALVATAQNSGASKVEQWNFNSGHDCDGLNHPRGMATDIKCDGNNQSSGQGASEDCNKIFKYLYDNYDELGLTELIWQYPPAGYSCNDPKINCDVSGHADHIHVGTRV